MEVSRAVWKDPEILGREDNLAVQKRKTELKLQKIHATDNSQVEIRTNMTAGRWVLSTIYFIPDLAS